MLVSVNPKPTQTEFADLMKRTDDLLNADAQDRPQYYSKRGGNPLEDDVKAALDECAKGTPFENTIEKISGQKFPDIVAARFYGVEVKSTKDDHWTSTGSSILESSRIADVERIYMTFGKLGGNPIEFLSRPYEECLSGIAVTHMPRYRIDMRLQPGQTIFDKMGVPYDELRLMSNPAVPVAAYYRSQLKPGETLWWASNNTEESVSATIRLWNNVSSNEKVFCRIYGLVHFPEIFSGDYDQYALWLAPQGIVDTHIRDQFSSSGMEDMTLSSGQIVRFPAIFRRLKQQAGLFVHLLSQKDFPIIDDLQGAEGIEMKLRIKQWCRLAAHYASQNAHYRPRVNEATCYDALITMFRPYLQRLGNETMSEDVIKCDHCGLSYRQRTELQQEGHREREYDICPYCRKSNGSSMRKEFFNRK